MSEKNTPKVISHKWYGHGVCIHKDDADEIAVEAIRVELRKEMDRMPKELRDSVGPMIEESMEKLRIMETEEFDDGDKSHAQCSEHEDRVHVVVTNLSKESSTVLKQSGGLGGLIGALTGLLGGKKGASVRVFSMDMGGTKREQKQWTTTISKDVKPS